MSAKQDHYEDQLNPTAAEFTLLILDELYDIARWICSFSLTRTIARISGHYWDPNGSRLPEWNRTANTTPVPDIDDIETIGGGFPIGYDGNLIRSETVTKSVASSARMLEQQEEITEAEWHEMKNYNPPLLNIPLARKIKRYWQEGHNDHATAVLAGCSPSYAKHHRLAFEKAAREAT